MSIESRLGIKGSKDSSTLEYTDLQLSAQMYDKLRKSPFYKNAEGWIESAYIEPSKITPRTHHLWTSSQLLGVLAESFFDKTNAESTYSSLPKRGFYDEQTGLWNGGFHDEVGWYGRSDIVAYDQHLGLIAEAQFNEGSARVKLDKLKRSSLYDSQTDEWKFSISNKEIINNRPNDSDFPTPLASSLLAEIVVGGELSLNQYEKVKIEYQDIYTPFKDPYINYGVKTATATRELFAVLLEAFFDKKSAKEQFQRLKNTPLYDRDKNLWVRWMSDQFTPTVCDSDDQLLAIIVESIFQK